MADISIKDKIPSIGAKMLNREFLVFLFLLTMTIVFWGVIVANEQYEGDLKIPVELVGKPKDVILLDESVDTLVVNLRESRLDFIKYKMNPPTSLVIQFSKYKQGDEVVVSNVEILKLVRQKLHRDTKINSIKRDALSFKFNHGQHKRLPVRFKGDIKTRDKYEIEIYPEFVDVYAQENLLKQLKSVNTIEQSFDVKDTVRAKLKLDLPKGSSSNPSDVSVTIVPVVYVEKSMEIPVECINEPANKKLRLFPSRVKVTFMVEMNYLNSLEEQAFRIVADYNKVADRSQQKCKFELLQSPPIVKNVKLAIDETDYLIEER